MMKIPFIVLLCLSGIQLFSQRLEDISPFPIPTKTGQVILVTTKSWDDKTGHLQCYQRYEDTWAVVGEQVSVVLGKSGLAWGKGLYTKKGMPKEDGLEKREGDGKAPAGVFTLGTMFGYSGKTPSVKNYPYKQVTDRDYWIDDPADADYNQWKTIPLDKSNNPKEHWSSFGRMKRADHLYEYGIVVNHDTQPVSKGSGSAIFMHVWRSPGMPTVGCTAMDKADLLTIMKWLDPEMNPVLIQLPVAELKVGK